MSIEVTDTSAGFAALGLAEPIMRAINDIGYTEPTPIQAKAIPQVLSGIDLLAGAQTGTGKTAGFALPLLHLLHNHPRQNRPGQPRCLILTPTRELAAQIEDSIKSYSKYLTLKSTVMYGGVNINPQIARLKKPLDILVATPGRLLDHVGQKTLDLSAIEILVLDEADRMLDMGFIRDIRKILALLPKKRQNLLFSATFSDAIKELADGLLNNPAFVEVARRNTTTELVEQTVHLVRQSDKRDVMSHLIHQHNWQQVLIFTRTKHGANRLAEKLSKDGIQAAAIHGNKSQSARTRALAQFKEGDIRVLVATDIAARGLDIDHLPQVVNFELPNVPEDYVHRIGRTGRAGSPGAAVSLVDAEEIKLLKGIERLIKREIPRVTITGFTASTHAEPRPGKAQPLAPEATAPRSRNHARKNGNGHSDRQERPHADAAAQTRPHASKTRHRNKARKPMSEAARHQAMPQRGLFCPQPVKPTHRGNRRHQS